jgi:hypothetical protein
MKGKIAFFRQAKKGEKSGCTRCTKEENVCKEKTIKREWISKSYPRRKLQKRRKNKLYTKLSTLSTLINREKQVYIVKNQNMSFVQKS